MAELLPFVAQVVERVGAAGEDAVERIVVRGGQGVEFVVVAAGARQREAKQAAADRVDAVVDDELGGLEIALEAAADGQEAERAG